MAATPAAWLPRIRVARRRRRLSFRHATGLRGGRRAESRERRARPRLHVVQLHAHFVRPGVARNDLADEAEMAGDFDVVAPQDARRLWVGPAVDAQRADLGFCLAVILDDDGAVVEDNLGELGADCLAASSAGFLPPARATSSATCWRFQRPAWSRRTYSVGLSRMILSTLTGRRSSRPKSVVCFTSMCGMSRNDCSTIGSPSVTSRRLVSPSHPVVSDDASTRRPSWSWSWCKDQALGQVAPQNELDGDGRDQDQEQQRR